METQTNLRSLGHQVENQILSLEGPSHGPSPGTNAVQDIGLDPGPSPTPRTKAIPGPGRETQDQEDTELRPDATRTGPGRGLKAADRICLRTMGTGIGHGREIADLHPDTIGACPGLCRETDPDIDHGLGPTPGTGPHLGHMNQGQDTDQDQPPVPGTISGLGQKIDPGQGNTDQDMDPGPDPGRMIGTGQGPGPTPSPGTGITLNHGTSRGPGTKTGPDHKIFPGTWHHQFQGNY